MTVINRGTDINAIVNKGIVLYMRQVIGLTDSWQWLPMKVLSLILCAPVIALLIVWGHAALLFDRGSADGPLGYTILVQK